jgi:hypothetical protein
LLETRVQHSVRDLVAKLVRVSFIHRLRCEQKVAWRRRLPVKLVPRQVW